jgi:hypothetical protein
MVGWSGVDLRPASLICNVIEYASLFAALVLVTAVSAVEDYIPADFKLPKGQVLLEIITSEGCSSCPPADKLVQGLVNEAQAEGHDIHLLAWHVDFWDKLKTPHGVWDDPYTIKQANLRTRAYAISEVKMGLVKKPVMATPTVLINGRNIRYAEGASTIEGMGRNP